jgi:hypothetical protein
MPAGMRICRMASAAQDSPLSTVSVSVPPAWFQEALLPKMAACGSASSCTASVSALQLNPGRLRTMTSPSASAKEGVHLKEISAGPPATGGEMLSSKFRSVPSHGSTATGAGGTLVGGTEDFAAAPALGFIPAPCFAGTLVAIAGDLLAGIAF